MPQNIVDTTSLHLSDGPSEYHTARLSVVDVPPIIGGSVLIRALGRTSPITSYTINHTTRIWLSKQALWSAELFLSKPRHPFRRSFSVSLNIYHRGNRAVGVEYTYNPRERASNESTDLRTARAKRLVIVCAGALGSPQILERSGIGRKDVLAKIGVQQVVDLPGVGENYQGSAASRRLWYPFSLGRCNVDHQVMFIPYHASEDSETLDGIIRCDQAELQSACIQFLLPNP